MWNVSTPANDHGARRRMAAMRCWHRLDNEVPVSVAIDAVITAAPLIEAADHVRVLWDVEPDEAPSPPQRPPLPAGGWFTRYQQ